MKPDDYVPPDATTSGGCCAAQALLILAGFAGLALAIVTAR